MREGAERYGGEGTFYYQRRLSGLVCRCLIFTRWEEGRLPSSTLGLASTSGLVWWSSL